MGLEMGVRGKMREMWAIGVYNRLSTRSTGTLGISLSEFFKPFKQVVRPRTPRRR